jgi:acetyltransferase-like isoleucine patch superfamily enzyme
MIISDIIRGLLATFCGAVRKSSESTTIRPKLLGRENIIIHPSCRFQDGVVLDARSGQIQLGEDCDIGAFVTITSSARGVLVDSFTTLGNAVQLDDSDGCIKISKRCTIEPNVVMRGSGKGIFLGVDCKISTGSRLDAWGGYINLEPNVRLGPYCTIIGSGEGVNLKGNNDIEHGVTLDAQGGCIVIGQYTGFGPYSVMYGHGGLSIGQYCAIACHAVAIPANHRFDRTDLVMRQQGLSMVGITIHDDVWLGAHSVILDGANIGTGCVVGAGSIIRGSIPEKSVVVGVPGKVIKMRGRHDIAGFVN